MVEIVSNCKNSYFVHRVTCSVHVDHGTGHVLGWDSALQHGPVFNHPGSVLYSAIAQLWDDPQGYMKQT